MANLSQFWRAIWVAAVWSALQLVLPCAGFAQSDDPPLEGPAFVSADEAYSAYKSGDYRAAALKARDAITQRPDVFRLRLLLIDALLASDLPAARTAVADARRQFGDRPELRARDQEARLRSAQAPASTAYKALEVGDVVLAERSARLAIESAPDVLAYRLLLLTAQLAGNQLSPALKTAEEAVALAPNSYVPLVWRAYLRQRMGDRKSASQDFNAILLRTDLLPPDRKNVALIAADAALTSNDASTALAILQQVSRYDPDVLPRLADAEAAIAGEGTLPDNPTNIPSPTQDCKTTADAIVCSLIAAPPQNVLIAKPAAPEPPTAEPAAAPSPPGYNAAQRAYDAQKKRDFAVAIKAAEEAVAEQPDNLPYRLLLINLLIDVHRYRAAETAATEALDLGHQQADFLGARALARYRQRNLKGAMTDWESALRVGLSIENALSVRLNLADAALAARQPKRALDAIGPLPASYEKAIRKAYALQAQGLKEEALVAFRQAGRLTLAQSGRATSIRAEIGLLIELDRKEEARRVLASPASRNALSSMRKVDLAYLYSQVGDDATALAYFDRARAEGLLPPRGALDAGYTAKRQVQNAKAVAYLTSAIDAVRTGSLQLDPQRLFETRREVADINRVWGINGSIFYGKTGSAPNPFAIVTPAGGYTSQAGTELYYRPEWFGYRNGATFEVFTRIFDTLYDQQHGPTGADAAQGMVGARWKPFSEINLVLEIDKLYKYGQFARDDTLLRAAYSYTYGTDLRVVDTNWTTLQIYSEIDRYFQNPQLVALAEARFGRSFRLDLISRNLVFFPHVVAAANYDDSFARREAYGIGAGSSLRYWFGANEYIAPPSYLELTLQYRARIGGDNRAQGVFAQTLINY